MNKLILFGLFFVLGGLGMFFLAMALRMMFHADPEDYKEAQRISGGVGKTWLGDVSVPTDVRTDLVTKGFALEVQPDGKLKWCRQRKLSLSALMHWRKL
jgi:hypothetical protein